MRGQFGQPEVGHGKAGHWRTRPLGDHLDGADRQRTSHPRHDEEQGARGPGDRLALAADGQEVGEEARHPGRLRLLRGAPRRSRDRGGLQPAAQPPARAADACRRGEGQARALREADRAHRRGGRDAADGAGRRPHRRGLHGPPASAVAEGARAGAEGQARHGSSPSSRSSRYHNVDPDNVRNMADIGGGAAYDIGCYPIVVARYIFGAEPLRVVGADRPRSEVRHRPHHQRADRFRRGPPSDLHRLDPGDALSARQHPRHQGAGSRSRSRSTPRRAAR